MIDLVQATNNRGSTLDLSLIDSSNGFVMGEIEGLGPVKANIVSSSFAGGDGEQYQSSRRDSRNIVLHIGLEPDWSTETVSSLRKRLYQFFMTKSQVSLRFHEDDGLMVDIEGRVETCEPDIFTEEPAMVVSILCGEPDFVEPGSVTYNGATTDTETESIIDYDGTIETGIRLLLTPDRAVPDFTVYHRPPDGTLRQLVFEYPLVANDPLVISTISGDKGAWVGGISALYGITPQSTWIELQPGENYIRIYAEGLPIPFQIVYTNRYGGL